MSISVGTIVTRYDPTKKVRTCTFGTCVGKITEIISLSEHPDNPIIEVKWWETCESHPNGSRFHLLDMLWEIGQI